MFQPPRVVTQPDLGAAIDQALHLADTEASTQAAAQALGTTGFIVHTAAFASFLFLRYGDAPLSAISEAISAGGDTDSIAAIVGAWVGARHGEAGLPVTLIAHLNDGPFGPTHLRGLAQDLSDLRDG